MSSNAVRYAKDGSGVPMSTRRWSKDAFDALLLDNPMLDVDHERASKRSRDALKRVFTKSASRASSRAGSRFGATPFSKEKVRRANQSTRLLFATKLFPTFLLSNHPIATPFTLPRDFQPP
jgi:hypothetical protein